MLHQRRKQLTKNTEAINKSFNLSRTVVKHMRHSFIITNRLIPWSDTVNHSRFTSAIYMLVLSEQKKKAQYNFPLPLLFQGLFCFKRISPFIKLPSVGFSEKCLVLPSYSFSESECWWHSETSRYLYRWFFLSWFSMPELILKYIYLHFVNCNLKLYSKGYTFRL